MERHIQNMLHSCPASPSFAVYVGDRSLGLFIIGTRSDINELKIPEFQEPMIGSSSVGGGNNLTNVFFDDVE